MRSNSGRGEGTNNNRNPTLKEQERARGRSGEAVAGERKSAASADRIDARDRQDG